MIVKLAREHLAQNRKEFAETLNASLGLDTITQQRVWEWEAGKKRTRKSVYNFCIGVLAEHVLLQACSALNIDVEKLDKRDIDNASIFLISVFEEC